MIKTDTFSFTQILDNLLNHINLTTEESLWLMEQLMSGKMDNIEIAAILTALRSKGETVEEIIAFTQIMRKHATKIDVDYPILIDTCGTGGDHAKTFNISTTVALLLAAGGYRIAKHGNRSITSTSGSADVLEALGVNINLTPEQVADCIDHIGVGFLFAPQLHTAMKHVMPVRKGLKVRTFFNLLGPLTNPAGANVQVIGLFNADLLMTVAKVLKALGTRSAFVVCGHDGLDEVSITSPTEVVCLNPQGEIKQFQFHPEDYGFQLAKKEDIQGGSPAENAMVTQQILAGEIQDARLDITILNAGFTIAAADGCDLEQAFLKARTILNSQRTSSIITKLVDYTNSL